MNQNAQTLKNVKGTIGKFHEEIKSNSITDFIVWLDCKTEYLEHLDEENKKLKVVKRNG